MKVPYLEVVVGWKQLKCACTLLIIIIFFSPEFKQLFAVESEKIAESTEEVVSKIVAGESVNCCWIRVKKI